MMNCPRFFIQLYFHQTTFDLKAVALPYNSKQRRWWRKILTPIGRYIRNAYILLKRNYICNADINELSAIAKEKIYKEYKYHFGGIK